jgi:hypothetical protein
MLNIGLVMPEHPNQPADLKHPAIRNWFWAREMFRRLGFPAEHLYFVVHETSPPRGLVIGIVLLSGDREFEWAIGLVETLSADEVMARYEQWVAEIKSGKDLWDLDEFFCSWAFDKRWVLMTALADDGFYIPKVDEIPVEHRR